MKRQIFGACAAAIVLSGLVGCNSGSSTTEEPSAGTTGSTQAGNASLSGKITIDGSSTVYPISQAVAEEFMAENKGVSITVGESGTSGGFKKFLNGEIDICDASRPITPEEIKTAAEKGIEFLEIPIAFDGLTVVVNKENTFAASLTVEELKKIWSPDSTVKTWKDVRADFPAEPIKLFGAGTDSGTFEYFTEAIVGKKKSQRSDYTGSEDDNQLVVGVKGEKFALGYFGYAYFAENTDALTAVQIDNGSGPVGPSPETIANGTYSPLSRPLIVYVTKKAAERPEVKAYLNFMIDQASTLVPEVKYVALPKEAYDLIKSHVTELSTGSRMQGEVVGVTISELLKRESAK